MDDDLYDAARMPVPKPTARELTIAVEKGDAEKVRDLLQRGADVAEADSLMRNGWTSKYDGGFTTLGSAAYWGYEEIAELLIEAGSAIDARDERGNTPLMCAAGNYKFDMMRFLVSKNASLHEKNDAGKTVWNIAAGFESMESILRGAVEAHEGDLMAVAAAAEAAAKAEKVATLHETAALTQAKLNARALRVKFRPK